MKKHLILIACLLATLGVQGQNFTYARSVVDTLCSPYFAGRGYLEDGDKKAADYIKKQFSDFGLKSFGSSYFQPFGFPVVVFPTDPSVNVDGVELIPGRDFLVEPGCRTINGSYEIRWVDSATIDDNKLFKEFENKTHFRRSFLVLDHLRGAQVKEKERLKKILTNGYKAFGLAEIQDKFTWSVATEFSTTPHIYVKTGVIAKYDKHIKLDIYSQVDNHGTQNVAGYIKGNEVPDTFIVFTAHYDHLGMMGKSVCFPGANDNASGVAMMLDLASYYAVAKPKYSVAFIAFAGEEAGLLGSYYYTTQPLFPLKKIKFLINIDLMGTGGKGMTAVNATVFPEYFNKLEIANTVGSYLVTVNQRGKAQNSDHYYFTEAGVPSFFFYLMGDYHFYHDPDDNAQNLKMEKYPETFRLIRDFVKEIEN